MLSCLGFSCSASHTTSDVSPYAPTSPARPATVQASSPQLQPSTQASLERTLLSPSQQVARPASPQPDAMPYDIEVWLPQPLQSVGAVQPPQQTALKVTHLTPQTPIIAPKLPTGSSIGSTTRNPLHLIAMKQTKINALTQELDQLKQGQLAEVKKQMSTLSAFKYVEHELHTHTQQQNTILEQLKAPDAQVESLSKQLKAITKKIKHLFETSLDLTKFLHLNCPVKQECFHYPQMLEKINLSLLAKAKTKNIELYINDKHEVPPFLFGDQERLHRLLSIFLSQAIKSTQNEGRVSLESEITKKGDHSITLRFTITYANYSKLTQFINLSSSRRQSHSTKNPPSQTPTQGKFTKTSFERFVAETLIRHMNNNIVEGDDKIITNVNDINHDNASGITFSLHFPIAKQEDYPPPSHKKSNSLSMQCVEAAT